ncbi:hypothetical protein [Plasmodium yoelii yoelii]|uniref:Uncharacterized protein n=1 Tax=Plasmodium yoelii yoelii TaxID=73239 RepID=Q7RRL8_PLAYO|nr:hypothetical protein [Plasmodium yoelii yoelii]
MHIDDIHMNIINDNYSKRVIFKIIKKNKISFYFYVEYLNGKILIIISTQIIKGFQNNKKKK